ncbi:hypothetical protein O9993_01675 [Vibrio lentus]|nr:hypothetical protein [Vibrio lentus]
MCLSRPIAVLIYDRNGVLLAESRPVFNLRYHPEKIKDMDDTLIGLQTLIEIPPERIERFNRDRRGDALSRYRFLTSSLKSKWLFFSVNQHKFPGVEVTGTLKRFYPYGDILTHVIGYVS